MCGSFGNFMSLLALQLILPNFLSNCEAYHPKHVRTRPRLSYSYRRQREQQIADEDMENFSYPTGKMGARPEDADMAANRFTTVARKGTGKTRTTPTGVSLVPHCDHLATSCLHAYKTGKLCGRTISYYYETFQNYCMLDYINCIESEEVWQVVHMGACFKMTRIDEYINYPYHDDFFLDQYYVVNEH